MNFPSGRDTFGQLLSNFFAAGIPSLNFCNLSVQPGDLLSTSVNFPCSQNIFCHLSTWTGDLPSTSVNFSSVRETFRQFPLTFLRFFLNFRQLFMWQKTFHELSMRPGELPSILSTFHTAGRASINCCHLFVLPSMFHRIPSSLLLAGRPSVNFC